MITIEELADGRWTQSGDSLGATWEELIIISVAKNLAKGKVKFPQNYTNENPQGTGASNISTGQRGE